MHSSDPFGNFSFGATTMNNNANTTSNNSHRQSTRIPHSPSTSLAQNDSFRRQSVSVKRNEGALSFQHPVELIPEPSHGAFHESQMFSFDAGFDKSGTNSNLASLRKGSNNKNSNSRQQRLQRPSELFLLSPTSVNSQDHSLFGSEQPSPVRGGGDQSTSTYYSPLFKGTDHLLHHQSRSKRDSSTTTKPSTATYDPDKRRRFIIQQVEAEKKRQLNIYSERALQQTAASKAKTRSKNVCLAEARKLHDAGSVATKLTIGPKHCQINDALKWMSKLSGDPVEDKKRAVRRAAEAANAQIARRRMSESESERRLLSLTSSLKNEMATFLNHLLDWASSGSAIVGRRNETERELAETVANRESVTSSSPFGDKNSNNSPSRMANRANLLNNIIASKTVDAFGLYSNHSEISGLENLASSSNSGAQQSTWGFLRASSKAAGNAALTVEAFAVLKGFFDILDADGSGSLTLDEIESAAKLIGREESSLVSAMKTVDKDQSGAIDFIEIVKVFFPSLSLAQIAKFERTHRDEIAKKMDPKVRMNQEDVEDILDVYQRLSRLDNEGRCTFDNMLSLMSDYMKERPEILADAFNLYDKNHDGSLTLDEFFDFAKFSYPPFSRGAVTIKDESDVAKRRSLLPPEDAAAEAKKKQQQQQQLLSSQQQQHQKRKNNKHEGQGDDEDAIDDENESLIIVEHALPKRMIVPNPPKTGLGTSNPNSIANCWNCGNLAGVTMEKQKERLKREWKKQMQLRKKLRQTVATNSAATGGHHHQSSSSSSRRRAGSSHSSNSTGINNNNNSGSGVDGGESSSLSRHSSSLTRSSSGGSRSNSVTSTSQNNNSTQNSGNSSNKLLQDLHKKKSASSKVSLRAMNDDDDDDACEHHEFSLDTLAEARWSVVREGLNKDPSALTTALVLGTRDLPPVDSLKHRLIQEHYRRYGTLPEIASARNLLIMARQETEKEMARNAAIESASKQSVALGRMKKEASIRTSSSATTPRINTPLHKSPFDALALATTNFLSASQKSPRNQMATTVAPITNNKSLASANVNDLASSSPQPSLFTASYANNINLDSTKYATTTSTTSQLVRNSFLPHASSPVASATIRPRNKARGEDGGIEVDAETAKAAASMFATRMPTVKRLERAMGGEVFTARGEFSPERAQRSDATAQLLEKIKSRLIIPSPRNI